MALGLSAANVEEVIALELRGEVITALRVDTWGLAPNHPNPFCWLLNYPSGRNVRG